MKNELLSITDENSILITAEFLESSSVLKSGDKNVQRYELDLIVKNTTTCNQLLQAVHLGLRNELIQKYHIDPLAGDDPSYDHIYYADLLHPQSEQPQSATRQLMQEQGAQILSRLRKRPSLSFTDEELDEAQEGMDEAQQEDPLSAPDADDTRESPEQVAKKNKEALLVCWHVFNECFSAYEAEQPVDTKSGYVINESSRSPGIAIGSVDQRKLSPFTNHPSRIWLFKSLNGDRQLRDLGFMTATRLIFDPIQCHTPSLLFDPEEINEAFRENAPQYNISDRPLRKLDDTPQNIIPPSEAPKKSKQNLIAALLSPLIMAGTMLLFRFFSSSGLSGLSSVLMSCSMGTSAVLIALLHRHIQQKDYREALTTWRKQYEEYIQRLLKTISQRQQKDVELLQRFYPPSCADNLTPPHTDLVHKILSLDGDIFSRGQEHPDFMTVRLGLSQQNSRLVPSVFPINGQKKEAIYASIRYQNICNQPGKPFRILLPEDSVRQTDFDHTQGSLIDLPSHISRQYSYLTNAPVLLHLNQCGALGVVFENPGLDFHPFLSNFLLNLCFYHSPEDLQFVVFCKETQDWKKQQETIRYYKHLPHFRELLGDLSAFAFNKEDADQIFNKLSEIMAEHRKLAQAQQNSSPAPHFPHIVVIMEEVEYEIKRHPISDYLPVYSDDSRPHSYDISFVFCKRFTEELPKFCGQVIKVDQSNHWFLLPHTQFLPDATTVADPLDEQQYMFSPDVFIPQPDALDGSETNNDYFRAFKTLSALYYDRIAQGADVPSSVDLFSLINNSTSGSVSSTGEAGSHLDESLRSQLKDFVSSQWYPPENTTGAPQRRDITKSLAVPIGMKAGGVVELDLHEKADGPHMLCAGTTGSGKTETILTYLIGLCSLYTPEQVTLLLMDMKGAGFVQRIGHLPHVVGTVTDVDGNQNGTSTAYMLKRFLLSMNAEVKRRKLLLSEMGVDSINGYIQARENLDRHIHKKLKLDDVKDKDRIEHLRQLEPLPHLFLVIDEFTELMQFSSEEDDVDFRKAITSLARIGRSLGFHIILISQNIEDAITPDIRVNSRARLCLKVATREASREMIGSDLAASPLMPGNGRAYLLVGTGSRFEYFQSGFSGADISEDDTDPVVVTYAKMSGSYTLFYDSESSAFQLSGGKAMKKAAAKQKAGITQLQVLADGICALAKEKHCKPPHQVFQPPLPSCCYYQYDWDKAENSKCVTLKKPEKKGERK